MESGRSPLARLLLFMICLAVAGSFFAGVHYLAIDRPAQLNPQAPENAADPCRVACIQKYILCRDNPPIEYYFHPEFQCMAALGKCYDDECKR